MSIKIIKIIVVVVLMFMYRCIVFISIFFLGNYYNVIFWKLNFDDLRFFYIRFDNYIKNMF